MSPQNGVIAALGLCWLGGGCTSYDPSAYSGSQASSATSGGGGATSTASAGAGAGAGGSGGTPGAGGGATGWPDYCSSCALTGTYPVLQGAIDEASGLAASQAHPGVYYVNNDSGDLPRFFVVGGGGEDDGILSMPVSNVDYEDIAVGPCAAGHCVFVGDIGDNDAVRPSCVLYRLPEPLKLGSADLTPVALPFVYPDGPHNAETLLIHPITGEIVIVTKVKAGASQIFRAPDAWAADQTVTLTHVGDISPPLGSPRFTGGSVHPAGHGVLLRTYTNVYFYAASAPDAPLEETLGHTPCALPVADELQGEGVSWTAAGDGYLTISEGASTSLHQASCHAK